MKKTKFVLFVMVALALLLAACGTAPTSETQVLGPINYNAETMPLTFSDALPTPQSGSLQRLTLYPAVNLVNKESAICQEPGSEGGLVVVNKMGNHPFPNAFCTKISTAQLVYVTMHDVAKECPGQTESPLCKDEINRLEMQNNATATMNVRIKFSIIVNPETALVIQSDGGFEGVMGEFNRQIKSGLRNHYKDMNVSLETFNEDAIASEFETFVKSGDVFSERYKKVFEILSFEATYLKPDGLDTEAAAQQIQSVQQADAVATEWYRACGHYSTEELRLLCECNYNCKVNNIQYCSCTSGIDPALVLPTVTPTATVAP